MHFHIWDFVEETEEFISKTVQGKESSKIHGAIYKCRKCEEVLVLTPEVVFIAQYFRRPIQNYLPSWSCRT